MELLTKCPEAGLDERRDPSPTGCKVLGSVHVERQETGWFLAHTPVGPSDGGSTKRAIKNKKRRLVINCPPVQKNYAKNMNGVDRNDRQC
jgi:hypothetical protein